MLRSKSQTITIMTILKNFLISIVLGLIAYEIAKIGLDNGFKIPTTVPELSLALLFITTAFVATFLGTGGSAADTGREAGTVKWFNVRKGYGFITRDQGEDVFVHFRNIDGKDRRAITEGQRVTFIVTSGDKGPQADKVIPL